MKYGVLILIALSSLACGAAEKAAATSPVATYAELPEVQTTALVVLGTVQDAGSPHIACQRNCCAALFAQPDRLRQVVALGLIDSSTRQRYLFEATPDLPRQMKALSQFDHARSVELADGIFLTHAHIGHYTGLMYLGKEATDAANVAVYAMPRMRKFLTENGPWDQLVERGNIELRPLAAEQTVVLSASLRVTPLLVPHRDEYSETVGYRIEGPRKSALFIPDIDKWEKWDRDILTIIREVDYAFLDATFFDAAEVNYRDISQIPHPFVRESLDKFRVLDPSDRHKVIFLHFNHTNPLLQPASAASKLVESQGFRIARWGQVYPL